MFVSKWKYEKLRREYDRLKFEARTDQVQLLHADAAYDRLLEKWNHVASQINAKGGQEFLDFGEIRSGCQLTEDEIKSLLNLCHPDKHDGKTAAVRMTQRLLEMRKVWN